MSLLMIPGPIEISEPVTRAFGGPPPGHLAPPVIEAFGASLERMREVWRAGPEAQPIVFAGSGTAAMEVAATNLLDRGQRALVVDTGYFSIRMAEMLRRAGVVTRSVSAPFGHAPSLDEVEEAIADFEPHALYATHVDTSTGVRVDAEGLCRIARAHGLLSVFDGVCATAAERFEMQEWGADCYLTASQKAIGLPVGLAMSMLSPRALAARAKLERLPPLSLDIEAWLPIMRAYEARTPSYFSTPATNLLLALPVALDEILAEGMEARFSLHARCADAFRAAFRSMGLSLVPATDSLAANTLSAVYYPEGVGPALVGAIAKRGVVVAGGLHPEHKARYFRIGHMGHILTQPAALRTTVTAIGEALNEAGHAVDVAQALEAFEANT